MASVMDELTGRGMIAQITDENLWKHLAEEKATIYAGFDPTADSLHVGHLVPIIALSHFQRYGHKVLALVGGATAMVGDPSGKSKERNLLTPDQVAANADAVKQQMSRFMEFTGDNAVSMLDNNDWIGPMTFIDWLRDVGKYFTVNYMMAKESVKIRLEGEQGISFTEFSYMTMQAYDFLHLYREFGCTIQAGGSDQWGNITAGMDLVHKVEAAQVYGITFPLMTTASGEKFGKSEGNPIWLDPERTSPYQFYQYWINTMDEDVKKFLCIFTYLDLEKIDAVCEEHEKQPEQREAQKVLASEITRIVHGEEGLQKAVNASQALFGGDLSGLAKKDLVDIFHDVPSCGIPEQDIAGGIAILDLLVKAKVVDSKGEGRRFIEQGGVYVNNNRISDQAATVGTGDLLADSMLVIRRGKKKYFLVSVERS